MYEDENDILHFCKLRKENLNNPCFAYYNINSLRYKFTDLKNVVNQALPEVLVLAETKLDSSFTTQQFFMSDFYYEPTRVDLNGNSGGLLEYVRKGVIRKRLEKFELKTFESIASEITINKQKYFYCLFTGLRDRKIEVRM